MKFKKSIKEMIYIKGVYDMNDIQVASKKLEQLKEEDYIFVTALIDRLLDPEWVMLSDEDIKDIKQSEKDFANGIYYSLDDVK